MMTEVKVKTEVPDDYIEEVIWQDDTKDSKKSIKDGPGDVPAEICVVIGGVRNQQTLDGKAVERGSPVGYTRNRYSGTWIFDHALRYTSGSYECGICGKKYKYYNCFQTHVRAHRDPYDQAVIAADEVKEEEPEPFQKIGPKTGNYTCEFCGKQYKYYTPYQEHVALHAPISEYPDGDLFHYEL
nr:PREDICTED: zinc finger protein 618-like [Struthio camelus australis]